MWLFCEAWTGHNAESPKYLGLTVLHLVAIVLTITLVSALLGDIKDPKSTATLRVF